MAPWQIIVFNSRVALEVHSLLEDFAGDAAPRPPQLSGEASEFALSRAVVARNLAALSQHVRTYCRVAERRQDRRYETDSPVVVVRLNPAEGGHLVGTLRNASRNGLGLWLPEVQLPGALLQVRLGTMFLNGEVRYCQQTEVAGWYMVGVSVHEVVAKY